MDRQALESRYNDHKRRNRKIDMTRGKPAPDQLDLSDGILTAISRDDCFGEDGTDYRNYGLGTGIPEAKAFFADFMEVGADEIIVGGNSSLNLMYDALAGAMLFGMPGGEGPWSIRDGVQQKVRFLCPVPGYDRHFAVCERLGMEMITVPMTDNGPDMDEVERLVSGDPAVKGIWCVPKYSNPTGAVYSDETVDRFAALQPAAPDFRILWDNAYAYHHLGDGAAPLKNILEACKAAGCPDRPILFGSTSKISYAGSGIAVLAGSAATVADAARKMSYSTIGPDKINQLRHVRFFGDLDGLKAHMDRHAALIAPKFAAVDAALTRHLGGSGLASWTRPKGGYFVSVDVPEGCAGETVRLAGEAGVKLTPAGATFPYGRDPLDRNIRLAPTMPTVEEINAAMDVFCTCVELASVRKSR